MKGNYELYELKVHLSFNVAAKAADLYERPFGEIRNEVAKFQNR